MPAIKYQAKGRYKVDIIYHFSNRIRSGTQICDRRHYNTDKEREQYINQSLDAHNKLAKAYNTTIIGLKVDGRFINPTRIANALE